MSILTKPYEITAWEDVFIDGCLQEQRLGVIGSNEMLYFGRALSPTLTRNVNGVKQLTFQMYKRYIDDITGEWVDNPFSDWLVSERKIKLKYEDKWYDFIIKDITETSTNYLFSYSLEDALVQELSKNGFGVTLDAELMNNIGDAGELGSKVLAETDWSVESEILVQTIDEALVYLTFPEDYSGEVYHIYDQVAPYTTGATEKRLNESEIEGLKGKTILAFYSSCKNKPHRFQFLFYSDGTNNPYGKVGDAYKIKRKDDRTIEQADCQYYIDFTVPENAYIESESLGFQAYLPTGFAPGDLPYDENDLNDTDNYLSVWYRGKRYGFSQQAVYVPILEKYCSKFKREEEVELTVGENLFVSTQSDDEGTQLFSAEFLPTSGNVQKILCQKQDEWSGIKILLPDGIKDDCVLKYTVTKTSGVLSNIGVFNDYFTPVQCIINGVPQEIHNEEFVDILESTSPIEVEIRYKLKGYDELFNTNLYITLNYGVADHVQFELSDISVTLVGDYLGYVESEFVSPTLIQNHINNYKFDSLGGWVSSVDGVITSQNKPTLENVYGRFVQKTGQANAQFISIIDEFYSGAYNQETQYSPYMKLCFHANNGNQFVLNSGPRDNRAIIQNMNVDEEWVLDYKIVDQNNNNANDKFNFYIGEYVYDSTTGSYNKSSGQIVFEEIDKVAEDATNIPNGCSRKIFIVRESNYNKDTFKKQSKVYLEIRPVKFNTNSTFYIEKIALYKKTYNNNQEIIIPDYDAEESAAAQEFVNSGVTTHRYHYFNEWQINPENPNVITNGEELTTIVKNTLDYSYYKPVYNDGAKKVRTVSAKESNYFNILQSIAETFEAWLDLEVERNQEDGAITKKVAKFKNYIGNNNYAGFRYGVNLKDIQRTYSSKEITTKLIVKNNMNELAKDGMCSIQRAGSNPTGENYIYDFQYYHNMGIMNINDYLNTAHYMEGAQGPDAELWKSKDGDGNDVYVGVQPSSQYTLNGYYSRVKKINDAILPINNEIIGLNTELTKLKSDLEVAKATNEAAKTGLEQVREDFLALTGLYPEEVSDEKIVSVSNLVLTPDSGQDWWSARYPISDKQVTITITTKPGDSKVVPTIQNHNGSSMTKSGSEYVLSSVGYTGMYINYDYVVNSRYKLEYTFVPQDDNMYNIGCHNASFSNGAGSFSMTVTDNGQEFTLRDGTRVGYQANGGKHFIKDMEYKVTIYGTFLDTNDITPYFWIQPNRYGSQDQNYQRTTCIIKDIKLYVVGVVPNVSNSKRTARFSLKAKVATQSGTVVDRTYSLSCAIPAGETRATMTHLFSSVDKTRTDVQEYIQKYTTYYKQLDDSTDKINTKTPMVANKEEQIATRKEWRAKLIGYKQQLNQLFFKKYSRFILEGTWLSEEYVDDDKYYADAQSVLYNSCYPQVAYTINVLSLSEVPGYELLSFDLGDKTLIIDEEFFGRGKHEEVIITEMVEPLDDPSQATIKVQNFKNQFQDLFQKITATVQQAQYSTGSYEKGAALANADLAKRNEFVTNAINNAQTYLQHGQTVTTGPDGITITDDSNSQNQLRMVGGAILFSTIDPDTMETTWMTGVTKDGISANLITAGKLDVGVVQIMSGTEPVFRWDAYGISAYDALWTKSGDISTISGINTKKFVRFDKYGIYGINDEDGVDGAHWHPADINEIDQKATFALTWQGLKVTCEKSNGEVVTARLGRYDDKVLDIQKTSATESVSLMSFDKEGTLKIGGWVVSQDGLEYNSNGYSAYLRSTAKEEYITLGGQPSKINTLLKIGNQFYVDSNGLLYCSGGYIGGMTVGDLTASVQNSAGAINDIGDTIENAIKDSPTIAGKLNANSPTGNYTWQFTSSAGISIKSKKDEVFRIGDLKGLPGFNTSTSGLYVKGHIEATSGKIGAVTITAVEQYDNRIKDVSDQTNSLDKDLQNLSKEVENIKTSIPGEGMPAVSENNEFSWEFDGSRGMFMYDGTIKDEKVVLGVYKPDGEDHYIGYLNGKIYATGGDIAGWTIGTTSITKGTLGTSGFHMYTDNYGAGAYFGASDSQNWAMGVGANFGVTSDGILYAKGAELSGIFINNGIGGSSNKLCKIHNGVVYSCAVLGEKYYNTTLTSNGLTVGVTSRLPDDAVGSQVITWTPYNNDRSVQVTMPLQLHLGAALTTNYLTGTWYLNNTLLSSSDGRLKHNIEKLDDRYSNYFDLISPQRFKYNDGTSNRYHLGFITQQIQEALKLSDISEKEFAGIATIQKENANGEIEEFSGLRYAEFVPLNTWQIQKLKPRVSALEQTILDYEARISNLETEIQNLKS